VREEKLWPGKSKRVKQQKISHLNSKYSIDAQGMVEIITGRELNNNTIKREIEVEKRSNLFEIRKSKWNNVLSFCVKRKFPWK